MAKDFKIEGDGNNVAWLECPVCEWAGDIYYKTKPPTYCSNACKQKAARQRKKLNSIIMKRDKHFDETIDNKLWQTDKATAAELKELAKLFRALSDQQQKYRDGAFTKEEHRKLHNMAHWILIDLYSYYYDMAEEKAKSR